MRRLILVVVSALVLSGCAYFSATTKLRECDALVDKLEKQLVEADSLVYLLEVELINKTEDLKECQASKNE